MSALYRCDKEGCDAEMASRPPEPIHNETIHLGGGLVAAVRIAIHVTDTSGHWPDLCLEHRRELLAAAGVAFATPEEVKA